MQTAATNYGVSKNPNTIILCPPHALVRHAHHNLLSKSSPPNGHQVIVNNWIGMWAGF